MFNTHNIWDYGFSYTRDGFLLHLPQDKRTQLESYQPQLEFQPPSQGGDIQDLHICLLYRRYQGPEIYSEHLFSSEMQLF